MGQCLGLLIMDTHERLGKPVMYKIHTGMYMYTYLEAMYFSGCSKTQ